MDSKNFRLAIVASLSLALLVACSGVAEDLATLGDIQASAPVADALPSIPMGGTAFHASDPDSVSLASGHVEFVEFFAYWCTVCKAMAPTVHGLEQLYGDQVKFIYLDRDDPATKGIRDQLGYIYQPHFFLLDGDGNTLGQWRGYIDGSVLQQAIVQAVD